jgi:hypothetical protein
MTGTSSPFAANELEVLCRTSEALLSITSEASAVALAELVVRRYRALKPSSRVEFFSFLLNEMGAVHEEVDRAIDGYQAAVPGRRAPSPGRVPGHQHGAWRHGNGHDHARRPAQPAGRAS